MEECPQPSDPTATYTATYDAWNRLVELSDTSGSVVVFEYDGLHRRIVKQQFDDDVPGAVRRFYYNEQWQCLVETEGTGGSETAEVMYLWHPHYVDALAVRMRKTADDEHFFTHDANFNITAAVQETTGDPVVERYAYTPYGEVTVLNADFTLDSSGGGDGLSDIDNEHLYTGRRTDLVTGLQLNRMRYYHAALGRWVNRDPIGYADGYNLYEYVKGMPADLTDPIGLVSFCVWSKKSKKECLNCCYQKYRGRGPQYDDCVQQCSNKWPDPPCKLGEKKHFAIDLLGAKATHTNCTSSDDSINLSGSGSVELPLGDGKIEIGVSAGRTVTVSPCTTAWLGVHVECTCVKGYLWGRRWTCRVTGTISKEKPANDVCGNCAACNR